MSDSQLPERASLEFLKKLAKERLRELRRADPRTKLAVALLSVAREYGFPSWRALKAEIESRAKGGWTALHEAARLGRLDDVRALLKSGADPNARESGDNTFPLHWAAANRHVEIARALLDAGGDPHGTDDVHELDAIGWATFFRSENGAAGERPEVAALLVERGAKHHIFSAISIGDPALVRRVAQDNPGALERRMSRFERSMPALHCAIELKRYEILDLLIELGASLQATDGQGHSALAFAMMRGDQEAVRRLTAAGASANKGWSAGKASGDFRASVAVIARSVRKGVPMIRVADLAKTLDWFVSIGFEEVGRWPVEGSPNWGMAAFGKAELMFMPGPPGKDHTRLWFYTDQVDELYELFKSRQIEIARAGELGRHPRIEFVEDIYDPPYGARQFSIRDPNGYTLIFLRDR